MHRDTSAARLAHTPVPTATSDVRAWRLFSAEELKIRQSDSADDRAEDRHERVDDRSRWR